MGTPGFFGIYNAQRGLIAAQMGLNMVNHNIANANTDGYSRQRIDQTASHPYQAVSLSSSKLLQYGQGVDVTGLSRSRDVFLDQQYRLENSTDGQVSYTARILSQVESIIGEPSDSGLRATMQTLFESTQDLITNPENVAARASFFAQADQFLNTLQQQGRQLLNLHQSLVGQQGVPGSWGGSQLGIAVSDVNSQLAQVADLNTQILSVTAAGGAPNDLLDKRDLLLDELSQSLNIGVTYRDGGQVDVTLGSTTLVRGVQVQQSLALAANPGVNADRQPSIIQTVPGGADITASITGGELRGILNVAGASTSDSSVYGTFLQLNTLAETLTAAFNTVQQAGRDLSGTQHTAGAYANIFELAGTYPGSGPQLLHLQLNQNLVSEPERLALAADDATFPGNFGGVGDSRNAQAFASIRDTTFASFNNRNIDTFHQALVAEIGIDTKAYQDRSTSQDNLLQAIDARRQSVSGVNMDEEAVDLIRYQRAFEASSRVMKAFNEVYQTILSMV